MQRALEHTLVIDSVIAPKGLFAYVHKRIIGNDSISLLVLCVDLAETYVEKAELIVPKILPPAIQSP